jgi:hypothetical protein
MALQFHKICESNKLTWYQNDDKQGYAWWNSVDEALCLLSYSLPDDSTVILLATKSPRRLRNQVRQPLPYWFESFLDCTKCGCSAYLSGANKLYI